MSPEDQHNQQSLNPFLVDAATLYCEEQHWDEDEDEDEEEEESRRELLEENDQEESYCSSNNNNKRPLTILEQLDMWWEVDDELSNLLSREEKNQHLVCSSSNINILEKDQRLSGARRNAVEWILKVTAHYSFSPLTAVLAANYLDRYLFSFQFESSSEMSKSKPWMIQLAAVASLSLAAKVEETYVPLLLDLQVEEAGYVFEAKTIQRMEILMLATLDWKMNPVTPLSFLAYITTRLGFNNPLICWDFLKRSCESLILSLLSECKFMRFLPSVMATATVLQVITDIVEPRIQVECHNQLLGILGINDKDSLEECRKLIGEWTSGGLGRWAYKRKFRSMPGSPKGVIDVSFSSDSSWTEASPSPASVSSSPEPRSKKKKAEGVNIATDDEEDILGIP